MGATIIGGSTSFTQRFSSESVAVANPLAIKRRYVLGGSTRYAFDFSAYVTFEYLNPRLLWNETSDNNIAPRTWGALPTIVSIQKLILSELDNGTTARLLYIDPVTNEVSYGAVPDLVDLPDIDVTGILDGDVLSYVGIDDVFRPLTLNISDWDTAYGWGDHGLAGYALSTDLDNYLALDQTVQQTIVGGPLTDFVDFNTAYADGSLEGRLQWNSEDGTLEVGLPGGAVNLQIGQEQLVRCKAAPLQTILNGSVVYVTGASGNRPEVTLANATTESACAVLGVATEDFTPAGGYVTIQGLIREVNTNGMAEGSPIWLSTVAGEFTTTQPDPPDISVFLGYVLREHLNEGIIVVRPVTVPKLVKLSDVSGTPTIDGQLIQWNNTDEVFEFNAPLDIEGIPLTEKTKLEDDTNWNPLTYAYIGVAIAGTFVGQRHYDADYMFHCVGSDNNWIRLPRA